MTGTGDESTRFPRSYALNSSAGFNEQGKAITTQWQVDHLTGGSGSATLLESPANTIQIVPVRFFFTDAWAEVITYQCTPGGIPAGGQTTSCVQGSKNKGATFAFFDGHAKNVPAVSTVANDMWGYYKWANINYGANYQRDQVLNTSSIAEWK